MAHPKFLLEADVIEEAPAPSAPGRPHTQQQPADKDYVHICTSGNDETMQRPEPGPFLTIVTHIMDFILHGTIQNTLTFFFCTSA